MSLSIYQYGNLGRLFQKEVKFLVVKTLEMVDYLFEKGVIPEPTRENTERENTHHLIELRDKFLECEKPRGGRYKAFRAMFNIVIIVYDFDLYYTERVDWLIEKLQRIPWLFGKKPRERWWAED